MTQYCETCLRTRRDKSRDKLFPGDFCDDCGAIYHWVEQRNYPPFTPEATRSMKPRMIRGWRRPTGLEIMYRSIRGRQ